MYANGFEKFATVPFSDQEIIIKFYRHLFVQLLWQAVIKPKNHRKSKFSQQVTANKYYSSTKNYKKFNKKITNWMPQFSKNIFYWHSISGLDKKLNNKLIFIQTNQSILNILLKTNTLKNKFSKDWHIIMYKLNPG